MSDTPIPPNVFSLVLTEAAQTQSQQMAEQLTNISHTNNIMRVKTIEGVSTLDPVTARAVDKILQQPTPPAG